MLGCILRGNGYDSLSDVNDAILRGNGYDSLSDVNARLYSPWQAMAMILCET